MRKYRSVEHGVRGRILLLRRHNQRGHDLWADLEAEPIPYQGSETNFWNHIRQFVKVKVHLRSFPQYAQATGTKVTRNKQRTG